MFPPIINFNGEAINEPAQKNMNNPQILLVIKTVYIANIFGRN